MSVLRSLGAQPAEDVTMFENVEEAEVFAELDRAAVENFQILDAMEAEDAKNAA